MLKLCKNLKHELESCLQPTIVTLDFRIPYFVDVLGNTMSLRSVVTKYFLLPILERELLTLSPKNVDESTIGQIQLDFAYFDVA